MVGDPKSLHDLHRVEAQVQVTCRGCRATETWELNALIEEVHNNGGNVDWRAARNSIRCPRRCASPRIHLLPIPYGRRRARSRAHRHALANLALRVLREAAHRSTREAVGTTEVRLALHVLRHFVRPHRPLLEYWDAAIAEVRHPWTSCHHPYRMIVQAMSDGGVEIDAENRP